MRTGPAFQTDRPVVVVSGLPRSGTSMMMRLLEAGGMPVLTDGIRKADADNPDGYYEFEAVKMLKHDASWLPIAQGKAVKMVYLLLYHLPLNFRYRVIFMKRELEEVVASQDAMLRRRGVSVCPDESKRLIDLFFKEIKSLEYWLADQTNFDVLYVNYNHTVRDPKLTCGRVRRFVSSELDEARMQSVVRCSLYRQRAPSLFEFHRDFE